VNPSDRALEASGSATNPAALAVEEDASLTTDGLAIAKNGTARLTIATDGSVTVTATNGGRLAVADGDKATGTLVMESGGQLKTTDAAIAPIAGSTGFAFRIGTDTKWTDSGTLSVGKLLGTSTAALAIMDGAALQVGGALLGGNTTIDGGSFTATDNTKTVELLTKQTLTIGDASQSDTKFTAPLLQTDHGSTLTVEGFKPILSDTGAAAGQGLTLGSVVGASSRAQREAHLLFHADQAANEEVGGACECIRTPSSKMVSPPGFEPGTY
jgi:T5SS/PEP-CTERM-associated repeat protein